MRTAIVVFAKTLGLTPVKTRLAAHIGLAQANAFYELSVKALRNTLDAVRDQNDAMDVYWALAEENGPQHPYWQGVQAFWTGEGDLGERLNRVTERLFETYDAVIMIGTDSPQLQISHFTESIRLLAKQPNHAVAGPCTDGGFYLFGTTQALGDDVWHQVRYSQSDTLQQLLHKIQTIGFSWSRLEPLSDVDVVEDLKVMQYELSELKVLSAAQNDLWSWLKQFD